MQMTPFRSLALQIVVLLAVAAAAVMWGSALMGSLDTYRAPFHGKTIAAGDPIGRALTRRVVFVYVDGLRVDTAANAHVMPYLNELRAKGASATSHSREPSYSVPGYTTMLSGAWPEFNDGPLLNPDEAHTVPWPQDNLFAAVKRAGMKVGLADHYSGEKLIPQDTLADRHYVQDQNDADDRAVTAAAVRWLGEGADQFILVHLDQVDHIGHIAGGPRGPNWNAAATRVDNLLRELGGALDLSRDTIFITSDHGHIDQGGHGGHEDVVLSEPWVLAGAGVKPGPYPDTRMIDIAPTLAALLGVSIPALSQGDVRTDMLQLTPEQKAAIEAAHAKQQAEWLTAYNEATGQSIAATPTGGASAVQSAVEEARATQAANERLPRIALALIPLLAIAGALWSARGASLIWPAIGALIYLAVFHAAYYLIEGRTYSLSSVLGADDILQVGMLIAAVGFVVACAIVVWQTNALRADAAGAATAVLGAALVTIAVVSLPAIVGYAVNGATITWVMPNFALMFFTFLTLLQIAGIALSAVALAAIAALASRFAGAPA
jgi:hypothetical protein